MQLIAGRNLRETAVDRARVKEAHEYLRIHSAKHYPPSLAAFPGLGSAPFCLYRCISFDRLHVLDTGIIRDIHDNMHIISDRQDLPTSRLIGLLNDRYIQLAGKYGLRKMRIFRQSPNARQAGMTGLVRRQSLPFMWVCLMGVTHAVPDEDPVLRCIMELDTVYNEICGWSASTNVTRMSTAHLTQLQERCFRIGSDISTLFKVSINTKMHRFMRHIRSHFEDFGDLFATSTEENERLHKISKQLYSGTNRRPHDLAMQIMKLRTARSSTPQFEEHDTSSDEGEEYGDSEISENDVLRNKESESCIHFHVCSYTSPQLCMWDEVYTYLTEFVEERSGNYTPYSLMTKVLTSIKHGNGHAIWMSQSVLRINLIQSSSTPTRVRRTRSIRPCSIDGAQWTYTHGILYRRDNMDCTGV